MDKQQITDTILRAADTVTTSKGKTRAYVNVKELAESLQSSLIVDDSKAIAFLEWMHKNEYFETGILEDGTHYWAKKDSTKANTSAEMLRISGL